MSSIRCGHHLMQSVALDFPGRIAGRTRHIVALVRDVLPVQLNCGRPSMDSAVRRGLVAVQN